MRNTSGEPSLPGRTAVPAAGICLAYAVAHLWWATAGIPAFMAPGESVLSVPVWVPAVPAILAAAATVLIREDRRTPRPAWARWLIVVVAAVAGGALVVYCFLFWIGLTMVLMVPFGLPMTDGGLFLVRAAGVVGGGLTLIAGREEFRQVRRACGRCGRRHGRSPERRTESSPWWGYAGAYLTIAGLVARLIGALPQLTGEEFSLLNGPGGVGFKLFVVALLLTGSMLPLALAYRWGRIWPGWVLPWAGRPVPRWVVLGPGVFMGVGFSLYFGVGGISAMVTGKQDVELVGVLDIGGYTVWGIGLLIASVSYDRLTKPACPHAVPAATRRTPSTGARPGSG